MAFNHTARGGKKHESTSHYLVVFYMQQFLQEEQFKVQGGNELYISTRRTLCFRLAIASFLKITAEFYPGIAMKSEIKYQGIVQWKIFLSILQVSSISVCTLYTRCTTTMDAQKSYD
jgi:hypothetical protein